MISGTTYIIIAAVAGLLVGFLVAQIGNTSSAEKRREKKLREKLRMSEDELTAHKQKVAEHFLETSNLISNMTNSYRVVFDHLAIGAKTLAGEQAGVQGLNFTTTNSLPDIKQATSDLPTSELSATAASVVADAKSVSTMVSTGEDETKDELSTLTETVAIMDDNSSTGTVTEVPQEQNSEISSTADDSVVQQAVAVTSESETTLVAEAADEGTDSVVWRREDNDTTEIPVSDEAIAAQPSNTASQPQT